MKKTTTLCLAICLAMSSIGTAQADRGRHGDHRDRGWEHRSHDHHGYRDHSRGRNWVGPAAILAITGLAIGAAAYSNAYATPTYAAPAYVAPPVYPAQAPMESGSWHYCGSSGQYYPYVRHCAEGWQTVMPPR